MAETRPIKVHIAGGDFLTRLGLAQLFAAAGYIEVNGISRTEAEAVRRLQTDRPDIAVIDTEIGSDTCLAILRSLRLARSRTKVIVLASVEAMGSMEAMIEAGAASFLDKRSMLEDIAVIVRIISAGGVVYASRPQLGRLSAFRKLDSPSAARFSSLSLRDRRIVRAIANGLTNAQIGTLLHISEATVKAHLAQIMRSVGIDNRVQLAVAADHAGLLSDDEDEG
ncbi:response regulator transcription factor [Acaricomes phytoseiuli]|uniref:response regulator transcription factor n=1 Tax=Acaricomes phytoseiuli TaxID=291968 RepID=UPI000377B98E|nr:response regulator transcription factor [Acaricomes phytoseiuli]MCW1249612.1 response regulator transcription factor [Acaricomes phytoseiuli]